MKTIFMPEETMKKWLAALRCGEYKQAKGALYDETTDGYVVSVSFNMFLMGR